MQTWKNTEYRYRCSDVLKYRTNYKNTEKYRKTDCDFDTDSSVVSDLQQCRWNDNDKARIS